MQTSTNSSITAASILNTINNTNESSEHSKVDFLTSVDLFDWNKSLFDSTISSDIRRRNELNNLMANLNNNANKNAESNKVRKPTVVSKYYQTICMMNFGDSGESRKSPLVDDSKHQSKLDKEDQTKDEQSSPISTQSFSSVSTSSSPST